MTIKIYEGKLGEEHFLCDVSMETLTAFNPINLVKGGLITGIKDEDGVFLDDVYEIIQVLYDCGKHEDEEYEKEIDVFVKLYEWN